MTSRLRGPPTAAMHRASSTRISTVLPKQRCLPAQGLAVARGELFFAARDFETLLNLARDIQHAIYGLGPMWSYDFAERIGAHPKIGPTHTIYAQRGALIGAQPPASRQLGTTSPPRVARSPPRARCRRRGGLPLHREGSSQSGDATPVRSPTAWARFVLARAIADVLDSRACRYRSASKSSMTSQRSLRILPR